MSESSLVHLRQVLSSAAERLRASATATARLDAELLLMFVLDCDRAYIHAHPERELNASEAAKYEAAIRQRLAGMPVQYITGHQEFWGLDFLVSPAVLIPRPETELLIETTLSLLQARRADALQPRIADVGTGSGCIALALAKELPSAEIHATDISAAALEVARKNADRLGLADRIHFREVDLLSNCGEDFDLIVSNPPYVGESERDSVEPQVRDFEPSNAVFAGPTGLEVIERLIPAANTVLSPGGWLLIEISRTIKGAVTNLLSGWEQVRIINDLQHIPRVVQARKNLQAP